MFMLCICLCIHRMVTDVTYVCTVITVYVFVLVCVCVTVCSRTINDVGMNEE